MVKGKGLGKGNGSKRERAPGLGSVLYTVTIPKLIKLNLRQTQLNAFCFSGRRITSIAPAPLCGCAILVQVINNL